MKRYYLSLFIGCLLWAWFVIAVLAGEPYQKFLKANCEWCGTKGSILNALNVHHFFAQSEYPEWRSVEFNCCTLCRKCHFVAHKRNWKTCAPEFCKLFGKTPEQIILKCVNETAIIKSGETK